jgi:hypothetical protein
MSEWVVVDGRTYVVVRNSGAIQNLILAGEAILVDVGEELPVYAVPVPEDQGWPRWDAT